MSGNELGHLETEVVRLREQVAQQQVISAQLTRYVTDLHKLLAERDSAKAAAERAAATQEDLLGQMSTDFLQPLGAIVGFAQVLLQTQRTAADRDALVRILDAGLTLERMVDALLQKVREQLDPRAKGSALTAGDLVAQLSERATRTCSAYGLGCVVPPIEPFWHNTVLSLELARTHFALDHMLLSLATTPAASALRLSAKTAPGWLEIDFHVDAGDQGVSEQSFHLPAALLQSCGAILKTGADGEDSALQLRIPCEQPPP